MPREIFVPKEEDVRNLGYYIMRNSVIYRSTGRLQF